VVKFREKKKRKKEKKVASSARAKNKPTYVA
jgi:hypothetical protein